MLTLEYRTISATTTSEITSAATDAGFTDNPLPIIAPATSSAEDSNTISWPGPNPCGKCRLPMLPPIALAQPPPLIPVVSHGSHALTDTVAANSATIQPGRMRGIPRQ